MIGLVKRGIGYFIVGYLVGLCTWGLSLLFSSVSETSEHVWLVGVMGILGTLLGGAVGVVELVWESPKKVLGFFQNIQWFLLGALFGAIGGLLSAFVGQFVFTALTNQIQHPLFGRICGMFIIGIVLGLMIGIVEKLRTNSWDRLTSVAIAGGIGGALTGAFRQILAQQLQLVDSLAILLIFFSGFVVSAIAIVTTLRTSAVLRGHQDNVSRTPKYGPGYEFLLSSDAKTFIGSGFTDRSVAQTQLKIYDDELVDSVQAVLAFSDDGWYLYPPPNYPEYGDNNFVNNQKIASPTRLKNNDIITFGQTKFYFMLLGPEKAPLLEKRNSSVVALIIAFVLALLSGSVSAQPATVKTTQQAYDMECTQALDTTQYPLIDFYFHTMQPGTNEPSFQQVQPMKVKENWSVVDAQGQTIGSVVDIVPLNAQQKITATVGIIVALDFSRTVENVAHVRIAKDLSILDAFLTKLRTTLPSDITIKLAFFPFASQVPKPSDIVFYSPMDKRARKQLLDMRSTIDSANSSCTAIFPMLRRSVDAFQSDMTVRFLFVISDAVHDLSEKTASYDCGQIGEQNFSPEERDPEAVIRYIQNKVNGIYFLGTKRKDVEGATDSDFIIYERFNGGSNKRLMTGGSELSMPAGQESKILYENINSIPDRLRKKLPAFETASEWKLTLEAPDKSRAALLGFPPVFLKFKEPATAKEVLATQECVARIPFMAIPFALDEFALQRKLITALFMLVLLWAFIGLFIFVSYLMVRRRHEVLANEEVIAEIPQIPKTPLPATQPRGDSRGGWRITPDPPKPRMRQPESVPPQRSHHKPRPRPRPQQEVAEETALPEQSQPAPQPAQQKIKPKPSMPPKEPPQNDAEQEAPTQFQTPPLKTSRPSSDTTEETMRLPEFDEDT